MLKWNFDQPTTHCGLILFFKIERLNEVGYFPTNVDIRAKYFANHTKSSFGEIWNCELLDVCSGKVKKDF